MSRLLRDDRGSEIAEWVVVVSFVLATGYAIYLGILAPDLQSAVDAISNRIENIAAGNPSGS